MPRNVCSEINLHIIWRVKDNDSDACRWGKGGNSSRAVSGPASAA